MEPAFSNVKAIGGPVPRHPGVALVRRQDEPELRAVARVHGRADRAAGGHRRQRQVAARDGDADVAGAHLSPKDLEKKGGNWRILFSDYDVWGSEGGATPNYFSEKFIKENPDVVRRFIRAMGKTLNWINDNPDKAKTVFARRVKVDPNQVSVNHYATNGVIDERTVKLWIDLLTDYKEIKPGIKPADIYTNSFNAAPAEKKKPGGRAKKAPGKNAGGQKLPHQG